MKYLMERDFSSFISSAFLFGNLFTCIARVMLLPHNPRLDAKPWPLIVASKGRDERSLIRSSSGLEECAGVHWGAGYFETHAARTIIFPAVTTRLHRQTAYP
jgi:hypothetical protein